METFGNKRKQGKSISVKGKKGKPGKARKGLGGYRPRISSRRKEGGGDLEKGKNFFPTSPEEMKRGALGAGIHYSTVGKREVDQGPEQDFPFF